MIARELARLAGIDDTLLRRRPGLVRTDIGKKDRSRIVGWVWGLRTRGGISAAESGRAVAWLATEPSIADVTGEYWKERVRVEPSSRAADPDACRRLWDLSERLWAVRDHCSPAVRTA
jgi:hypothetical protein